MIEFMLANYFSAGDACDNKNDAPHNVPRSTLSCTQWLDDALPLVGHDAGDDQKNEGVVLAKRRRGALHGVNR
jgi:hypothetical protein